MFDVDFDLGNGRRRIRRPSSSASTSSSTSTSSSSSSSKLRNRDQETSASVNRFRIRNNLTPRGGNRKNTESNAVAAPEKGSGGYKVRQPSSFYLSEPDTFIYNINREQKNWLWLTEISEKYFINGWNNLSTETRHFIKS